MPTYIDRIKRGHIVPGAPFDIVNETPSTLVADGHWGFGYVVSERAMGLLIEKGKQQGSAAATVYRQSHVGRVADYPLMAAREGMIGLMTADSGRTTKNVAPFGGREPRLGTNPICVAVPSDLEGPLFVDMATSAVAAGKIELAAARGVSIPEGWVVDSDGNPATDPNVLRGAGGALLPLGGSEGYKGYGLSVIVEILSGLLTGLGFGHDPRGFHNDGCFMAVFDVAVFRPLDEFKRQVAELAGYLKASKRAAGFDEILYPRRDRAPQHAAPPAGGRLRGGRDVGQARRTRRGVRRKRGVGAVGEPRRYPLSLPQTPPIHPHPNLPPSRGKGSNDPAPHLPLTVMQGSPCRERGSGTPSLNSASGGYSRDSVRVGSGIVTLLRACGCPPSLGDERRGALREHLRGGSSACARSRESRITPAA